MKHILLSLFAIVTTISIHAEDGHQLWLRYQPVNKAKVLCDSKSATIEIVKQELETYYHGAQIALKLDATMPDDDGYRFDGSTLSAPSTICAC